MFREYLISIGTELAIALRVQFHFNHHFLTEYVMLRTAFVLALGVVMLAATFAQNLRAEETLKVLTDRTESHLKPLFDHYTRETGVKIQAVYLSKGMSARLEAQPNEAHVVITKNVENLEDARRKDLLAPITSEAMNSIPAQFRDQENFYMVTSYRIRGMFLDNEAFAGKTIGSYMDLTKPEYKGKIAIRSGYHGYNMSMFTQMAESEGIEYVEQLITGLKANLARVPKANDRGQVRAIHDGVAELSVGNSYYYALMLENPDQKPWAMGVKYAFPEQDAKGAYPMRSAAGLTKVGADAEIAQNFIEFLASDFAQFYNASVLNEYSINPAVPVSGVNVGLAADQANIVDGKVKINFVDPRKAAEHREAVVDILNKVNFDQ